MTTTAFNAQLAKAVGHTDNSRVDAVVTAMQTAFASVRTEVVAGMPDRPTRAKALADFGNCLTDAAATLASNLRGAT
jgi:hypothetical protein